MVNFQEYPKILYLLNDIKTVESADEEAKARGEGFHDYDAFVEKEASGKSARSKKAGSVKSGDASSS